MFEGTICMCSPQEFGVLNIEALLGCRDDNHPCALLGNLFEFFNELGLSEVSFDRETKILVNANRR